MVMHEMKPVELKGREEKRAAHNDLGEKKVKKGQWREDPLSTCNRWQFTTLNPFLFQDLQ